MENEKEFSFDQTHVGKSVRFKDPSARLRLGDGPYVILSIDRLSRAVELEIGHVSFSDVELAEDNSAEPAQSTASDSPITAPQQLPHPSLIELTDSGAAENKDDPVMTVTPESAVRRIETISGTLLIHPDNNVRLASREILSLLWEAFGDEVKSVGSS